MGAIPVHLERRFEQRWASRFGSQAVSIASKNAKKKTRAHLLQKRLDRTNNATLPRLCVQMNSN
jgi:hypothetical protein